MYKNIFVPLDGSTFGEHALPLAMTIARKAGASLTLAHVHAPLKAIYLEGAAFLDESLEDDLKAQQRAYLETVAQKVRAVCPVAVETKLTVGDVAAGIAEEAARHAADLVVATTHGRGVMGRFWLGSVADELLRLLPMPLLLVRPHQAAADLSREPALGHLLIALDGTELAEQVIEPAVALGQLLGSDFTLVRIVKPVVPANAPAEPGLAMPSMQAVMDRVDAIQRQLQDDAKKYLDGVAARLRGRGLNVQTRVDLEEQPGVAIVKESERPDIDLVALATHGRRGLSRLFLGSVADKVIRGSSVPILLHRPVHPEGGRHVP